MLATNEVSLGVNLHAIAFATAVMADVSSKEFIAYHLSVGYATQVRMARKSDTVGYKRDV